MNKLKKEYAYSHNAEEFYGYYRSREEAIREGSEYADENQKHIYTGEIIEPKLCLDADWNLERVSELAFELSGGASRDYGFLDSVTNDELKELENGLNKIFNEWLNKYHKVNFFTVGSVSIHKFRE